MENQDLAAGLAPLIRGILSRTLPMLATYYMVRAFGFAPHLSLAAAIVVVAAQAVFIAIREHKLDFVTAALLLFLGATLAITLATQNARIALMANLIPVFIIDTAILVSGLIRKPTTLMLIGQFLPNLSEKALAKRAWREEDLTAYRALHSRMSILMGVYGLTTSGIAIALLVGFSVDIAQLFIAVIKEGFNIVLLFFGVKWIQKFIRERSSMIAVRSQ